MRPGGFAWITAKWWYAAIAAVALLGAMLAAPAKADSVPSNLADLSLEELANIEITSVSKLAERLSVK